MKREVITGAAGLQGLERAWYELQEVAETSTPFQSFAWVRSWWETFGAGTEPRFVLLTDGDGACALAPLVLATRGRGPLAYRALELAGTGALPFLGMGLADRVDLLLGRRRRECLEAIVDWLAGNRRSFDVVDLRFVPAAGTTARELPTIAAAAGLVPAVETCSRSSYLPLDGTWAGYLAGRGQKFRKNLKRARRLLEARGEVRLRLDAGREAPLAALERAVELSRRSWKGARGTALLQHARVREMLVRLLPRLTVQDGAYLALAEVDGAAVAHEIGFRHAGKLWAWDSCYDPAYAAASPGTLLMAALIEKAFDEGLEEYDLGRGDAAYKRLWGRDSRSELQIVLSHRGARSRLVAALAFAAKWQMKRSRRLLALQSRLAGAARRFLGD